MRVKKCAKIHVICLKTENIYLNLCPKQAGKIPSSLQVRTKEPPNLNLQETSPKSVGDIARVWKITFFLGDHHLALCVTMLKPFLLLDSL